MGVENKDSCSQRDSAEREGYVRAHRSFRRIWKERDSAQPELLEEILEKDNLNRAFKRVKANKGAPGFRPDYPNRPGNAGSGHHGSADVNGKPLQCRGFLLILPIALYRMQLLRACSSSLGGADGRVFFAQQGKSGGILWGF